MALALERALERFGSYLHFDGNQAGARSLVDIVVTHDLQVTFTDDWLNAEIQVRRAHNDLDRGRSIATSETEQTPAQKRDAGVASVSTPEKNIASNAALQQSNTAANPSAEVLIEHGEAPFDFDKNNRLSYFVRTITETGQERLYWGKDLPRALEEAGAKVGDSITAKRTGSRPVVVEKPDGSTLTVRIEAKRNSWRVDNHGVSRVAVIKAYGTLVKIPEDRKRLEMTAPLLVAARDQAVVELKREKLAAELAQRKSQNHTFRL